MLEMVFRLFGGIGLFLLGMVLLTDGLKACAGESLRTALVRFTRTPTTAFLSGMFVTVLVQSSSATTVMVIGFVSSGLLTFPQALGVVFGASLGTTGTGWVVSTLGLKINLGLYALPLIGIGAFLRLLLTGRGRSIGLALAGFGVIFVGIDMLQLGMQGLSTTIPLSSLPSAGLLGHFLAVAIGIFLTVVMQSSSAAVATTLTALHSNAINFDQAASLVIGAAIGTTVTGALAAIGGSIPAQRTAAAHVLFNLATGLIALILLPLFLWGISAAQTMFGLEPGAVSLAAFHTAFIFVGVVIFLPFVQVFANAIERMLPERGPQLTRHLDRSLLETPAVALEATRRALSESACELFVALQHQLKGQTTPQDDLRHERVVQALDQIQEFSARIPAGAEELPLSTQRVGQLHAMDHLLRLQSRYHPPAGIRRKLGDPQMQPAVAITRQILELATVGLRATEDTEWLSTMETLSQRLTQLRQSDRPQILQQTALGDCRPDAALWLLDAIRWTERIAHHTWRTCAYLVPHQEAATVGTDTDDNGNHNGSNHTAAEILPAAVAQAAVDK